MKLAASATTEAKIDAAREQYRSCAVRASVCFFALNELSSHQTPCISSRCRLIWRCSSIRLRSPGKDAFNDSKAARGLYQSNNGRAGAAS